MLEWGRLDDLAVPDAAWGPSLTAMRRTLASRCDARIAAGGATAGYRGDMPGVAEEVLLSLDADKPTFVTGALGASGGGCARHRASVRAGNLARRRHGLLAGAGEVRGNGSQRV